MQLNGITFFKTETTSSLPNFMVMTLKQIDSCLEENKYRSGFPGMNGRAWTRIGTIYDLVAAYFSSRGDREHFMKWLQGETF